jgi:hypothetical protein
MREHIQIIHWTYIIYASLVQCQHVIGFKHLSTKDLKKQSASSVAWIYRNRKTELEQPKTSTLPWVWWCGEDNRDTTMFQNLDATTLLHTHQPANLAGKCQVSIKKNILHNLHGHIFAQLWTVRTVLWKKINSAFWQPASLVE